MADTYRQTNIDYLFPYVIRNCNEKPIFSTKITSIRIDPLVDTCVITAEYCKMYDHDYSYYVCVCL